MLALASPGAMAQTTVEAPRTIRVVLDNAYAPYSFQSDAGKLQGILVDQWQAWEKKTGIKVEIHGLDWGEALRRMRAGEFDVIDSIVETPERRDYFDFTPTYAAIEVPIFFRNEISGVTDITSLKGFPVGVKMEDQHIDKLKAKGVTTIIPFQSYDAMIAAAKQHKINVFVADHPSALYLLNKMGIEAEFRQSAPVFRDELRRAVRKGDAATLRMVSDGFAAIAPGELKQIDEKWFGSTINRYGRYLTYGGCAAALALLLIAGLSGWNRTLRKRIQRRTAALAESEQRFRQIAENIREVFWLSNPEATLVHYVSPAYEKIWGRSCESLYAEPMSWIESIHPDDREPVAEAVRLQPVRGQHDHTYRIVRPDGSLRWIRDRAFPVRDKSGKLIRVAGIAEDITERKKADETLRRSEGKFKTLFGIAPVGISVLDRQRNIVDANPALEQITRLSKEELLNGTYRQRTYLNADGTPKPPNEFASERAISGNRPFYNVETGIVTENGEIIWTQVSVAPLALPDASAVVITQDITERKQAEQALRESEERFREVAENIDDLVWLSDPLHKELLYISPAYERIWGRTRASVYAAPRSWTEALHPEDRERILELRGDDHLHEMPDMTYRIVRPDGSLRWLHSREFPVKGADGKIVRIAGIVEDITERKRVELALDERLRFETLLTELSAAFANLPTTTVDEEIDKWLQNLVEFLDLDRATFDQIGEDGATLSRSHSHTARGIEPLSLIVTNDQLPWMTEQLLQGNTIKWSRIPDDMPEQASKEKEFAGRVGAKSVLIIPVCIGGSLICAISFTSMRIYRDWPDETVARLRLVGEIFANAIARKRAEEALFRREVELDQAQSLASLGSWEWDVRADAVTWSDEVRRIYGFKREDLSSPEKAFSAAIHPDDRVRRNEAIDAALNGGPPYNVEFRIIRPDKSVRFVHSRGRLIYDKAGKPFRMFGMAQDITERKWAAKELEEANHQLRLLSRRLFEVQEEERCHLARELHDEIGQSLTAAKINLQSVTGNAGSANFARLQETTAILDRLLGQVRQISLDLRPSMLDDLGLVPALRSLLDQQGRRGSVAVRLSAENIPEQLDPEIQTTCFRIAQEAITNALRHAGATRIDVDLRYENAKLWLLIRDNGIGFDVESAQAQTVGLGLIGIQERATLIGGQARIISSPKKGTRIEVSLPLVLRARGGRD
jgi:PAS domain S-box-containing protein